MKNTYEILVTKADGSKIKRTYLDSLSIKRFNWMLTNSNKSINLDYDLDVIGDDFENFKEWFMEETDYDDMDDSYYEKVYKLEKLLKHFEKQGSIITPNDLEYLKGWDIDADWADQPYDGFGEKCFELPGSKFENEQDVIDYVKYAAKTVSAEGDEEFYNEWYGALKRLYDFYKRGVITQDMISILAVWELSDLGMRFEPEGMKLNDNK